MGTQTKRAKIRLQREKKPWKERVEKVDKMHEFYVSFIFFLPVARIAPLTLPSLVRLSCLLLLMFCCFVV